MANVGDRHRQVAARRQEKELQRSINLNLKHFQRCSQLDASAARHPIFELAALPTQRDTDDMSIKINPSPSTSKRNSRCWKTETKGCKLTKPATERNSEPRVHKHQSDHSSLKLSRENAASRVKKQNQISSDRHEQQQQLSTPRRPSTNWMDEQAGYMGAATLAAQRVRERAKLEQDLWSSRYQHIIDNQATSVESMHMDNLLNFQTQAIVQPPMDEEIKILNIIEDRQKVLGLQEK